MSQAGRRDKDKDALPRVSGKAEASNSSHRQQLGVVKEEPEQSSGALSPPLNSDFDWNEWMLGNGTKLESAEMTPGDPWQPFPLTSPQISSPCGVDNEWLSKMLASIKDFDSSQMPRGASASHAPTPVPSAAHMPGASAHMPAPTAVPSGTPHMPGTSAHMPAPTAVPGASAHMPAPTAVPQGAHMTWPTAVPSGAHMSWPTAVPSGAHMSTAVPSGAHMSTAVPSGAHMTWPKAAVPSGAHMTWPTGVASGAHMPTEVPSGAHMSTEARMDDDTWLEAAELAQQFPATGDVAPSLSASSLDTLDSPDKGGEAVTSAWETPARKRGASQVAQYEDDDEDLEGATPHGPSRGAPRRRRKGQVVRQQVSKVFDVVQDGHRWRKYGQKEVKGRNYPRSYYRCSYKKCEARKQVQLDPEDERVVMTTYEGAHSHPMPQVSIPSYLMPVLRGLLSGQQPECPVENEDWFQDIYGKLGHELKDVLKLRNRPHRRNG